MTEARKLNILFPDSSIRQCLIEIAEKEPWVISLSQPDLGSHCFEGENLSRALVLALKFLEGMGCKLLCNGARTNVVVSGMSRQMGGGRKAYIAYIGEQARREDMVDIFDDADLSLIGTMAQQSEFYKEWVTSIHDRE
jgi:hypothetical protein